MLKSAHFALATMLCLSNGVQAASPSLHEYAPLNRPTSGTAAPNLSTSGVGLGTAILAAYVNTNGTLIKGAGTAGSYLLNTGQYEVDFDRDVSSCFYNASTFTVGLIAFVEPRATNSNGVFVGIQDTSKNFTSGAFYLLVFCNQ